MKYKLIAIFVLCFFGFVAILTGFFINKTINTSNDIKENPPEVIASSTPEVLDKGVHFGEVFVKENISITPIELIGDSRCANGVFCVYAGNVIFKIKIKIGNISRDEIIESDRPFKIENYEISVLSVYPYPEKSGQIPLSSYTFEFDVKKVSQNVQVGECFVGGCSGQICSDKKDIVSTCEWRESYACYADAKCERQQNGQCGWTETESLKICLETKN